MNSISEVYLEESYSRDELFALCDWFAEGNNVIFGSVNNNNCFRAEIDDTNKEMWCIKEYWVAD